MSVLIKGAEMPTNCMGCPYEIYANCIIYQALSARDYSDCRHPDCPLVEIPPHGRLIDADRLSIQRENYDTYNDYSEAFDMIDNAPTVIASEGNDEYSD